MIHNYTQVWPLVHEVYERFPAVRQVIDELGMFSQMCIHYLKGDSEVDFEYIYEPDNEESLQTVIGFRALVNWEGPASDDEVCFYFKPVYGWANKDAKDADHILLLRRRLLEDRGSEGWAKRHHYTGEARWWTQLADRWGVEFPDVN